MKYDSNELDQMSLTQLSTIITTTLEDERLVQEKFEQRARVTPIELVRGVDVRYGWQEKILSQVLADRKHEIVEENAATLSPEDQQQLDAPFITKEKELELQAKIDAARGIKKEEPVVEETPVVEAPVAEVVEEPVETPKKVTKSKKK